MNMACIFICTKNAKGRNLAKNLQLETRPVLTRFQGCGTKLFPSNKVLCYYPAVVAWR